LVIGIDPKIMSDSVDGGTEGHFGLSGMRERARVIGGKLTVCSALDSRTEAELSIPASRAYAHGSRRRLSQWAEKLSRKRRDATVE